ncbi:hypothetical protein [Mammaliicoccus sciuri]|uniref:hypothetical protein n=1 Tax=Mammaliicoccus sciuri TaxID=1296 RepID=UPI00194F4291|nr:hypothetical protein [Mammaliicoccus sciuri]
MPTIKTKKEMNLPELIEWAWNNKELSKNKQFTSKNKGNLAIKQSVIFNHFSYAEIENNYCYGPEDIFTVETEEEITEDTVLPRLVKYTYNSYYEHRDKSINMLDRAKEWSTFYYKDDNENMYLIWRDGKLVE